MCNSCKAEAIFILTDEPIIPGSAFKALKFWSFLKHTKFLVLHPWRSQRVAMTLFRDCIIEKLENNNCQNKQ